MSDLATAALAGDGNMSGPQTSQAAPPTDAGTVGDASGGQTPAWTAQLPDDLKSNESLTRFSKLGDLGKAYLELAGERDNLVKIPGEGATEEEWAAYRKQAGVPDSPEDYALQDIPGLSQVQAVDKDAALKFGQMFQKAGLTKQQAQAVFSSLVDGVAEQQRAAEESRQQRVQKATSELQGEWREKYNAKLAGAKAVIKDLGGDDFAGFLDETGLSNDPRMIRFVAKVAERFSNDSLPPREPTAPASAGQSLFPKSSADWAKNRRV